MPVYLVTVTTKDRSLSVVLMIVDYYTGVKKLGSYDQGLLITILSKPTPIIFDCVGFNFCLFYGHNTGRLGKIVELNNQVNRLPLHFLRLSCSQYHLGKS